LVHLYLRIFNLSFEKNQNQEAGCTATFAQPSKKYVLTMLDLLIHAQTSDIPEVLLALKQVMF